MHDVGIAGAASVMGEEIVNAKALDRAFVDRMNRKREDCVLGAMHWRT